MTKQSRLRVNSDKRGRRIILNIALIAAIGVAGWYLEWNYQLITSLKETLISVSKNLAHGTHHRGEIYDRNLKQIAINKERVSVYVRTQEIVSIPETVKELAPILSLDEEQLKAQLESGLLRLWIAEDISQDQEIALKAKRLSGVYLQREEKRVYPNNAQAAHLVGYVDNGIGLAGVEAYYDRLAATKQISQDAKGHFNAPRDLVLTLDLKIQDILDGLVDEIKKQQKADRVLAYIIEMRTGEVIGGAQLPGFDPNFFTLYPRDVLDSILIKPVLLPDKFRLFLRDAALLQVQADDAGSSIPWSLRPNDGNLGSQLQLWDWLGLNEKPATDFCTSAQQEETVKRDMLAVTPSPAFLGMVPEQANPLNLLKAFSVLLNNGEMIRPFVVKKSVDIETGMEVPLVDPMERKRHKLSGVQYKFDEIRELFRAEARPGEGRALFFQDQILAVTEQETQQRFQVNDMLFVTIPAGGSDMAMLVYAVHDPEQPSPRNATLKRTIEEIVEEKVERISILQQVAKSVADVVEPELSDGNNYQGTRKTSASRNVRNTKEKDLQTQAIMPDLQGLSLRKSLRLLQGIHLKISIQGTGKVVSQRPLPGKPLQGVSECTLVLEKGDDVNLDKLSRDAAKMK